MVIDQGNYHIADNDLQLRMDKFVNIGQISLKPVCTLFCDRSFKKRTNYESWQNSRSIAVLRVFLVCKQAKY